MEGGAWTASWDGGVEQCEGFEVVQEGMGSWIARGELPGTERVRV